MEEERIRQMEQEESDRFLFFAAAETEFEIEHQAQVDAEKAEARRRVMELEAKRLRVQLEDRERLAEQQCRNQELREQESLQEALEESRREEERREELRQETLREERRRNAAFEEAGRLAQKQLLEEANRVEAERIAEETLQAQQSRRANVEATREEENKVDAIKSYPLVGSKISLLLNNSVRYSGILYALNNEDLVMNHVANHGTEGRYLALNPPQPEEEIAGDFMTGQEEMRFLKSDIQNIFVHNGPANKSSPLAPPSRAEFDALEKKHDAEIAELKRQARAQDAQNRASDDKVARLEGQVRELMRIMTSSSPSPIAESPSNSRTYGTECVICIDGPKTIVILPCKHLCLCKGCSVGKSIKTCPICFVVVEDMMDIVPS